VCLGSDAPDLIGVHRRSSDAPRQAWLIQGATLQSRTLTLFCASEQSTGSDNGKPMQKSRLAS
jgi:hypothetical protein